jgi:hypothetical protein
VIHSPDTTEASRHCVLLACWLAGWFTGSLAETKDVKKKREKKEENTVWVRNRLTFWGKLQLKITKK